MDVEALKRCLTKLECRELGIPVIFSSFADSIFPLSRWALEGSPLDARQVWFCVGNVDDIRSKLPAEIRNRVIPLHGSKMEAWIRRAPTEALLLPHTGFLYADPNLIVSSFWATRGSYRKETEFSDSTLQLWIWTPKGPRKRLFGLDHHHAVQWDVRQILSPLGVRVDFHWLCDGRPPINEALPTTVPGFSSSLDLYKAHPQKPLSPEFVAYIKEKKYDGVLTSHSLVTTYRLRQLGLPCLHVNSTRFGNEWIQSPENHQHLVSEIQTLLTQKQLWIAHNNKGDMAYFHQYFPCVDPTQELGIPSLCESPVRFRLRATSTPRLLIWDTRQVLLQQNGSPFMKELFQKGKQAWGPALDSQALLMAEQQAYLPEGYLDSYTAVIHIPYNISTMSITQQVRANLPIWVPSKRLLAKLWADPMEPNELSWTVFAPGSETTASAMDRVRDPAVIERWISLADFYDRDVLPLVFEFDSIEELLEKGLTTDYQSAMDAAEASSKERRDAIVFGWDHLLRNSLKTEGPGQN